MNLSLRYHLLKKLQTASYFAGTQQAIEFAFIICDCHMQTQSHCMIAAVKLLNGRGGSRLSPEIVNGQTSSNKATTLVCKWKLKMGLDSAGKVGHHSVHVSCIPLSQNSPHFQKK